MTTKLTFMLAATLGIGLVTACGDKDGEDTGAAGTTDDGGTDGGTTDGGTTDGGTTDDFFEPSSMLFTWQTGVIEGAQGDVLYSGKSLGHIFSIYLTNEDWGGFSDTRNFCSVTWDTTGASVATDCTPDAGGCWAGAAWDVNTAGTFVTDGDCDDLDPAIWSDDVAGYLSGFSYSYGFGPVSAKLESTVEGYYPTYTGNFVGGMLKTDVAGDATWTEFNWGLAYEVSGAELNDSAYVIQEGGSFIQDGFYIANPAYGFNL